MELQCTKCKCLKDFNDFPTARSKGKVYENGPRKGKSSHCNACASARAREWALKNKDKVDAKARSGHLRRKFGLTVEQYNEMLSEQGGVCGICKCTLLSPRVKQKNFCVDHNHSTGAVRGILCDACNLILGNANDDVELLSKCIHYLEERNG